MKQIAISKKTGHRFHSNDVDWIVDEPTQGFTENGEQRMRLDAAASSDVGFCREKNEDSFYIDSDLGLYIVCDGKGGHVAGEVASRKAVEFTCEFFAAACRQRILPRHYEVDFRNVWSSLMAEAIEHCCQKVLAYAQSHPEMEGMATTITAVKIVDGYAFVGHLGDSRLYFKSGNVTKQLTTDHNLYSDADAQDSRWINSIANVETLKRFKHVLTRCVGFEKQMKAEVFSFPLSDKDVLLLCSDGLSNYLNDAESLNESLEGESSSSIVEILVDFANSEGGSDNITAIVVRVSSDSPEECRIDPFLDIEHYTTTHCRESQAF